MWFLSSMLVILFLKKNYFYKKNILSFLEWNIILNFIIYIFYEVIGI